MQASSMVSKIALGSRLFLNRESPLIYHQCNARDVENSELIGQYMTTALSVSNSNMLRL